MSFDVYHPEVDREISIPFEAKLKDFYLNENTYNFKMIIEPLEDDSALVDTGISTNITFVIEEE